MEEEQQIQHQQQLQPPESLTVVSPSQSQQQYQDDGETIPAAPPTPTHAAEVSAETMGTSAGEPTRSSHSDEDIAVDVNDTEKEKTAATVTSKMAEIASTSLLDTENSNNNNNNNNNMTETTITEEEHHGGATSSNVKQQPQPPAIAAPTTTSMARRAVEEQRSGGSESQRRSSRTKYDQSDGAEKPQVTPSYPSQDASSVNSNNTNNNNDDDDDDDDVASKAAVALAAVAAAATANNKSPAEAAREARAVAQSLISKAAGSDHHHGDAGSSYGSSSGGASGSDAHRRRIMTRTISLSAVKTHLRRRALETGSAVTDKLCQGDNDAFLQYLLLLEYFHCIDDSAVQEEEQQQDKVEETDRAALAEEACEKLEAVLKKVEVAYDSLLNLLPPSSSSFKQHQQQQHSNHDDDDDELLDPEPPVIHDLLPPCTSMMGDATSAFFRACMGDQALAAERKSMESAPDHAASAQEGTALATPTKSNQQQQQATHSPSDSSSPNTPPKSSVFSMFRRSSNSTSATKPARKKTPKSTSSSQSGYHHDASTTASSSSSSMRSSSDLMMGSNESLLQQEVLARNGEYAVKIEREMLGLTVENVLERTVVRTVAAGGPAKKAGAKVGSLIVKVGNVETKNLTHFETIDELRQSNRPLQLVLRQVSEDALRAAREEMGRLIRGSGFGTILDGSNVVGGGTLGGGVVNESNSASSSSDGNNNNSHSGHGGGQPIRPLIGADLRIDAFTNMLRRRFAEYQASSSSSTQAKTKKEEALARVGDKLIWILTLLVIGLEREASQLAAMENAAADPPALNAPMAGGATATAMAGSPRHRSSMNSGGYHSHTAKDYADAAKSVSRVLADFARKRVAPKTAGGAGVGSTAGLLQPHGLDARKGPGGRKMMPSHSAPGRAAAAGGRGGLRRSPMVPGGMAGGEGSVSHEKPLLQIGDVLHRTRTFLVDTSSPPAALLRGEVIAFLCDVLDIDTDMELSEEEAVSQTRGDGAKAGAINDLGSAGSLLKLIILNCPIMRSPACKEISARHAVSDPEVEAELKRRYGPRAKSLSARDLHRLHAGNRFLSVVHRLAASRSTSARITACSLGPVIWGHLDFPHQLQLRGVITRALHDVEVIVRKSTATVLHEIAELVFDARSVPWLVLMCERAMTDPEPQLRSAAMTLTWHLADHLPNAFLGDASEGSRYLRRLPSRDNPIYADVYLLQCKLLPVATRLAEDRSPSVRLAVAAQCDRLCDALGDHWSSVIIDVLLALLSDSDERVRCEGVSCVPRLAEIVLLSTSPGESPSEDSILEALIPASIKLKKDPSSSVRVALAEAAGNLLKMMVALQNQASSSGDSHNSDPSSSERSSEMDGGRKYKRQVDERLIPLVQNLLNDNDPEVTSAALRAVTNATRNAPSSASHPHRARQMSYASEDDAASLSSSYSHTSRDKPVFVPVLSEGQVLRLLPTLTELSDSKQWRVRQSAVEIVPALLGCTQRLETRSEISKLCVRLMSDQVDAVRKAAAECLCMGGSSLGSHGDEASAEWITSIVIPTIRRCAIHAHSKQRLLSLKMVEVLLLNGGCPVKWRGNEDDADRMTDSPMRELAAIALSLATDRIANVRLNVGRVLEAVIDVFEEEEVGFIKEVLSRQIAAEKERDRGGDRDVLYFANRCVHRAKLILEDKTLTI